MYTCFIAPYLFAFDPQFDGLALVNNLTLGIDCIFIIDIIVSLRTTYVNNTTGDEIYSPTMIGKHYVLTSQFFFDFVSCLPFDYFSIGDGVVADLLGLVSMFKIARVFRISRIISNLNVK